VVRLGVGDAVVRDGVGDAVVRDGVGFADVGAALVGVVPPLQVTPFTVNDAGLLYDPVQVPWKPNDVDAPVASGAFHDMFVAVSAVPEAVQFADQPLLKTWPEGSVNRRVHVVIASPGLDNVMFVVKPPLPGLEIQLFGVYVTLQAGAANAMPPATIAAPPPARARAAVAATASVRRLVLNETSLMPAFSYQSAVARADALAWRPVDSDIERVPQARQTLLALSSPGPADERKVELCPCRRRDMAARGISPCETAGRRPHALAEPPRSWLRAAMCRSFPWEGSHEQARSGSGRIDAGESDESKRTFQVVQARLGFGRFARREPVVPGNDCFDRSQ